jgi:hypothetical protein
LKTNMTNFKFFHLVNKKSLGKKGLKLFKILILTALKHYI